MKNDFDLIYIKILCLKGDLKMKIKYEVEQEIFITTECPYGVKSKVGSYPCVGYCEYNKSLDAYSRVVECQCEEPFVCECGMRIHLGKKDNSFVCEKCKNNYQKNPDGGFWFQRFNLQKAKYESNWYKCLIRGFDIDNDNIEETKEIEYIKTDDSTCNGCLFFENLRLEGSIDCHKLSKTLIGRPCEPFYKFRLKKEFMKCNKENTKVGDTIIYGDRKYLVKYIFEKCFYVNNRRRDFVLLNLDNNQECLECMNEYMIEK